MGEWAPRSASSAWQWSSGLTLGVGPFGKALGEWIRDWSRTDEHGWT